MYIRENNLKFLLKKGENMETNKKNITAEDLSILLSERYCSPAWAYLPQVRNGTGYQRQTRTADGIAMSLFPSRGLDIHGFEIKISMSDWKAELKNPEKAEEIAKFCDYWWIVTTQELGKNIMEKSYMPDNWGLMVERGTGLYVMKQAKKLDSSKPDRLFLGAILRKVCEYKTPKAEIQSARIQGYTEGFAEGKSTAEYNYRHAIEQLKELEAEVKKFQESSGICISRYTNGKELGDAVKAVLNGEHMKVRQALERQHEKIKEIEHYNIRHKLAVLSGDKCCDEHVHI